MENITKAFDVLLSRRNEMESFIDHYVFKKMNINKDTFLDDEKDFLLFVKFCLSTAQRPREKNIMDGLNHFKVNYNSIKKMIKNKNIKQLRSCIYSSPGMGQKIGSMMLEFIYLYSNVKDNDIANVLYVPLDTHVIHLFDESFHLKNIPNDSQLKINGIRFIEFQESLKQYTKGKPTVYFDYLWFIGKMFCNKINENNENSRGYKLCNYCWIKDFCDNNDKWI
jgi:endonuclease III